MKVIPIQGLKIKKPIIVPIQSFTLNEIRMILGVKNKNNIQNNEEVYVESIIFVNREYLSYEIEDQDEEKEILNKFKSSETFALIDARNNKLTEFYDIKVALGIIYIVYRLKTEENRDFFKQILVTGGYFSKGCIQSTKWDVSIGAKSIDENDFYLTVPTYYTLSDMPESWQIPQYQPDFLKIDDDISEEIKKLCSCIIGHDKFSRKIRSAINLLYSTLPMNNLDLNIITYATILETLLLSKRAREQRKSVAARAACLIKNNCTYSEKEYIANWVFYFYGYRNDIVHEGLSYIDIRLAEEGCIFDHVISFMQHLIYNLIIFMLDNNIKSIKEIEKIVDKNRRQDNLSSGFDYITQKMIMYYED